MARRKKQTTKTFPHGELLQMTRGYDDPLKLINFSEILGDLADYVYQTYIFFDRRTQKYYKFVADIDIVAFANNNFDDWLDGADSVTCVEVKPVERLQTVYEDA